MGHPGKEEGKGLKIQRGMSLILESNDLIFGETKAGDLWRSRKSREGAGSTYLERDGH